MLDVRGVGSRLGTSWLFSGIDLEVRPGRALLLRGPNGSGKSTFLKVLGGFWPPDRGEVRLHGKPVRSWSRWERELMAPFVDQDPVLNLEVPSIDNLIDSQLLPSWWHWWKPSRRRVRRAAKSDAAELLKAMGLLGAAEHSAWELSYGQRRLLTLARALRPRADNSPRLLLLDEPFAGLLDQRARVVVEVLNERLRVGWAVVIAEHLPVARRLEITDELTFPALLA